MRIFHIATAAEWDSGRAAGAYATSTLGRTLAEEGYIHASRGDQWQGVRERYYSGVTEPLVLLVIDTDRLTSPVVDERVGDGPETFPHVYGPINPDAVVQTLPLDDRTAAAAGASFSQLFLGEVTHRVVLAIIAMTTALVGALIGALVVPDPGAAVGLLIGFAVGIAAAVLVHRRR
ncbi:DUF952 domain-containing protein [Nocardioides sp. cx-169]|uniref:DUF952 domain-containing protein n=1 Tax=Nocardioides sp. cx-169 TaxID=2899080 RepID=UPI001E4AA173|nr:DUF952 domain-containing protein [Nocardioides sp. cx-169]MCD4534426.1 DUF952 domain-containing protein [Nocardioides sp. cx-169]